MWRDIARVRPNKRRRSEVNALRNQIEDFNAAMRRIVADLQTKAQRMLDKFDLNLRVEIIFADKRNPRRNYGRTRGYALRNRNHQKHTIQQFGYKKWLSQIEGQKEIAVLTA